MPWSGDTFSRTDGTRTGTTVWTQAKAASVKIVASGHDTHDQDLADGISACLKKDGGNEPMANLPMAGFKHTGVDDAAARDEYMAAGQIQDGEFVFAVAGGTADALTVTLSPAPPALVDGMEIRVRAAAANTTTTPTFSLNGLTAHTITKEGGAALAVGDIAGAGHELLLRYNSTGTRWELLNPKVQTNINVLTEDTAPDVAADYAPVYDASASGNKKVLLENLGRIRQIVSATNAVETSTTSASYVTTGLSAAITPKSTTSKIAVFAMTAGGVFASASTADLQGTFGLFRGTVAGTLLTEALIRQRVNTATANLILAHPVAMFAVDSPATVAATTYTLGMFAGTSTSARAQSGSETATILLVEFEP